MLISEQVLTLGYRYDPDEHRNRFGVWESDAEYWHDTGTDYKDPDKGRLVNPRGRPPDPADHPFFKVHPVSAENVMASYDRSGAATRQQGMRWYADAHTVARALAHGDADKGAGVLAAYSPQTGWPANMLNAARALELGRAIGPGEGMITKDMQAHAQRAIDGAKADEANTSSKTKAFARLIRNGGDSPDDAQGDVVVDRHAMTVAMGQRLPKTEADKAPIGNDRYYQHVADAYREAARRISERDGTPIAPHQLQAITWLQQQGENEAIDAASGTALNKGRASMMRNAWNQWGATAKAEEIPTYPGTTMLDASSLISSQVMDFGHWDGWRTEPRDSRGRWTRFGGVGEAVRVMEKEREGFSVSPHSGDAPQSGYMVALDGHTHRYPAEILDDPDRLHKAIDDMLMSERESFQGKDMYLGGWVEDGKLWLDPSQNVQDRSTAEHLGKARDQVGIFDLQNFSTIDTGGSGGGRIIDHQLANPAEGPRGGSRGILGHARGRAPGRGSEDRRRYQGGIAAQLGYVELAWRDQPRGTHGFSTLSQQFLDLSWRDAWRHELRGPHGEWVTGAEKSIEVGDLVYYKDSKGRERTGKIISRNAPIEGHVYAAQVQFDDGLTPRTQSMKTEKLRLLTETRNGEALTGAAARSTQTPGQAGDVRAVHQVLSRSSAVVPGMFSSDDHLDWDGKDPTIFTSGQKVSLKGRVLAEVDWDGHISIRDTVANGLAKDQANPTKPVSAPENYTVPLHEMIHAVIPAGQSRETNGDADAYQDLANADIEEGFTELGTIQHAGDFFDEVGVADRQTPVMGSDGTGSQKFQDDKQAAISSLAAVRDKLMAVKPSDDRSTALDTVITAMGSLQKNDDPYTLDDVILWAGGVSRSARSPELKAAVSDLKKKQLAMVHTSLSEGDKLTMGELADKMNDPKRIRDGNAWGHYPAQTAQAFEWVSMIAQMRTGKPENHEDTREAIESIADEVNAVGTAAKVTVMARHVAGDMTSDPKVLAQILPGTEDSIRADWGQGDVQAVYQRARAQARQRVQQIEAERQAA
jgi:hypothetical protein